MWDLGVTLFDPLRRWGATRGTKVGIVGIGGLGQMGIKLAKAMGCEVTAISRSVNKESYARGIGADSFLASVDTKMMASAKHTLELILNTIPNSHDYDLYSQLLVPGGKQIILGINSGFAAALAVNSCCCGNSKVKAGLIGSIEATQAVINLCAENKIRPDIQVIGVDQINW